ncbi:LysE family translocator [Vibrio sp. SCSIO 43137]|uniref:LysE family translocator n=1 Tax=Vibrio sp. SCSIO 43137 TaxID=3021011 RepID=UPI002307084C|nr:LysE family translocator [Vibrio sp. SCSIO 43137]WCE31910.1 LysE family translocator [Vibrio sp. SCSIO 43137]
MTFETWIIYFLAVFSLSLAPGPNGLLALSHGAMYGKQKTLFTICGGVSGFMLMMALSMLGINAVLLASADILALFRWIGGGYLIWLGIQLWKAPAISMEVVERSRNVRNRVLFRQGLLAAVSNPKVLLFFAAFLPQFIDPDQPLLTQFLIMAATFGVTEFLVEYALMRIAGRVRPWLEKSGKKFNRTCGGLFAVIGASLPLGS